MLASVAASPVSRPGPWYARVQPASEPVFQPLMACGWFFNCCARVGFPYRCVSFLWLSVFLIRTALLLVLPFCLCCPASVFRCLYKRVWRSECRVFVSWIAPCSCQVTYPSCLFWVSVSSFPHTCLPLVHISLRVSFLSLLLPYPGPEFLPRNLLLWLRMCPPSPGL